MLNVVAIMGRLVADPELRTTNSGTEVCSFRIACDRSFVRQGEQRQADFIDIVAWKHNAGFVTKYFQKGSLIAIEVVASNINFAGPKNSNQSGGSSGGSSDYQNHAPANQEPLETSQVYSDGSAADDFAVIDDTDDLPF